MSETEERINLAQRAAELTRQHGRDFVRLRSHAGLEALINNRGIYWREEGLVEVTGGLEYGQLFLLNLPSEDIVRDYLEMSCDLPKGEVRQRVSFCFDPQTNVGELKAISQQDL
jgi:hypothetical protein